MLQQGDAESSWTPPHIYSEHETSNAGLQPELPTVKCSHSSAGWRLALGECLISLSALTGFIERHTHGYNHTVAERTVLHDVLIQPTIKKKNL